MTDEHSDREADEPERPTADGIDHSGSSGLFDTSTKRRTVLGVLGAGGLLGLASSGATGSPDSDSDSDSDSDVGTTATALEFGGTYSGAPTSDDGLGITNSASSGFQFGVKGRSQADLGRGIAGYASGENAVALFGRHDGSAGGVGIRGKSDATTGFSRGIFGTVQSPGGTGIYATNTATNGTALGLLAQSNSPGGKAIRAIGNASSGTNYAVYGETNSPNGWGLYTPDNARIEGNLEVGGTKEFVQAVQTDSGPKTVHYNAIEAGDARTEASDVAELEDGRAVVELPEHFGMVTSDDEPVVVQVTPYASEEVHPQVVEKSTSHVVIEDFGDGPDDYTVSYTVKGIREGFENTTVVEDS